MSSLASVWDKLSALDKTRLLDLAGHDDTDVRPEHLPFKDSFIFKRYLRHIANRKDGWTFYLKSTRELKHITRRQARRLLSKLNSKEKHAVKSRNNRR